MDLPQFYLQSFIFGQLSNLTKTGNSLQDVIMSIVMIIVINQLINLLKDVKINDWLGYIYHHLYSSLDYIFQFTRKNHFIKEIHINEVTENKELNQLYVAFYWYVSSKVNLREQTPLKYSSVVEPEL